MDVSKLDVRIRHLFVDRSAPEQFLALAMCHILKQMAADEDSGDGTSALDSVIGQVVGGAADMMELIDGRPLLDYHGKTAAQLRGRGTPESTIQKVRTALSLRGFDVATFDGPRTAPVVKGGTAAPAPKGKPAETPAAVVKDDKAQGQGQQGQQPQQSQAQGNGAADAEPVFAGHKLSELAGKSDKDLLAIEGISAATIKKIREAEAAAKK